MQQTNVQLMLQADGAMRFVSFETPEQLPQFAFSPKAEKPQTLSRHALCIQCEQPIHEKRGQRHHFYAPDDSGPYCPTCIGFEPETFEARVLNTPTKVRAVNPPSKADPDWDVAIQGKPRFSKIPLHRSERAPIGTAKPYLPESFASKEAEYNFLVATQDLDVARVDQELAQINISAFSADDPLSPAQQITDANVNAYRTSATPYNLPDPDLLRRIEWERFVSSCSVVTTIRTVPTTTGRTIQVLDKRWSKERIDEFKQHFADAFRSAFGGLPPQDEIESTREHIRHFRLRAIDFAEPEQKAAWFTNAPEKREYLSPPMSPENDLYDPAPPSGEGPKEIGLHDVESPNEPGEGYLWPLTPSEKAWLERHHKTRSVRNLPPFEAYLAASLKEHAAIWSN